MEALTPIPATPCGSGNLSWLSGFHAVSSSPSQTAAGDPASCWTMEAAYGLPVLGGRFTGNPHAGFGLAAAVRSYTLGWRLSGNLPVTVSQTFHHDTGREHPSATASSGAWCRMMQPVPRS